MTPEGAATAARAALTRFTEELLDRANLVVNRTNRDRHALALIVRVHTEPTKAFDLVRKVGIAIEEEHGGAGFDQAPGTGRCAVRHEPGAPR
jgi:hypothetical protein